MSSVFLSDVDDYLAPSQACVNPLFTSDRKKRPEDDAKTPPSGSVGRVRRKRQPLTSTVTSVTENRLDRSDDDVGAKTVNASIADCLACSGCVTTAETVLVEQHSVKAFRSLPSRPGLTISPASWADLFRHLELDGGIQSKRQLTTVLVEILGVWSVLDGNVPLTSTLCATAAEFCQAYRQKQTCTTDTMYLDVSESERLQNLLTPSVALSRSETQFVVNGSPKSMPVQPSVRQRQQLPLITASCPAVVCLIEKSLHRAVPHLSTVKSPMAAAAAFWGQHHLHVAVMPCHDKKLEASRNNFRDSSRKDVELVITTQELLQMLLEHVDIQSLRQRVRTAMPAALATHSMAGTLSALPDEASVSSKEQFMVGSGGYADFVFRAAARELFGVVVEDSRWTPVATQDRSSTSVRVAALAQKRRDHYEKCLYRTSSGTYSTTASPGRELVLRFVVAYGMQTVQRALQPFRDTEAPACDFMEIMACPSGCVNGGGQLRVADRETPTETRHRVAATQLHFTVPGPTRWSGARDLYTSYHVVPPLQFTVGAAGGVAVKDMQW